MNFIQKFINSEKNGGNVLIIAFFLAFLLTNSPLQSFYQNLINICPNFNILGLKFCYPLTTYVNEVLMTLFFLVVGLELKREIFEGHLKNIKDSALPAIAALGGVIFPALIYIFFTFDDINALKGWAIPTATDIVFATGVLSLLGNRVPKSLKVCLLSLAIFDDIIAILIIVIFYTNTISMTWLLFSTAPILLLIILNYKQIKNINLYMIFGCILWLFILKSGIHTTISGIVLGSLIPFNIYNESPLKKIEKQLRPWVTFIILPIFIFCNSGITIKDLSLDSILHPIAIGIFLGLFLGKQCGVMLFSYIALKLNICNLPINTNLLQFYGMSVITGIGFTMSFFIGNLSFFSTEYQNIMKLGVIMGCISSGIMGYSILSYTTSLNRAKPCIK